MNVRDAQNELLRKLANKINLNFIAQDPLIPDQSLVPLESQHEDDDAEIATYSEYLHDLRKFPTDQNFLAYLTELDQSLPSITMPITMPIKKITTNAQKQSVHARKIWSDTVSDFARLNSKYKKEHNVEAEIIARLEKLGVTNNPKKIIQDCVYYLKNHTAIVVTFKASLIRAGIADYQMFNMYDIAADTRGKDYYNNRDNREKILFQKIGPLALPHLFENFKNCLPARPRYGALKMLDNNNLISATPYYGKSFVVLQEKVKLNCLFSPCDTFSMEHYNFELCTYHDLEFILLQSSDILLQALVAKCTTGILPQNYSQDYQQIRKEGGYIEVLLPAINLFDPAFVQHIHFNKYEYSLTQEEINFFNSRGITVTNDIDNPYPNIYNALRISLKAQDLPLFNNLLNNYPSLAALTFAEGYELIHIAAQQGNTEMVIKLIAKGADPNVMTPDGKTALHLAVESTNLQLVEVLLNINENDNAKNIQDALTIAEQKEYWDIYTQLKLAFYKKNGQVRDEEELLLLIQDEIKKIKSEINFKKLQQLFLEEIKKITSLNKAEKLSMEKILALIKINQENNLINKVEIVLGYIILEIRNLQEMHKRNVLCFFHDTKFKSVLKNIVKNYFNAQNLEKPTLEVEDQLVKTYENYLHGLIPISLPAVAVLSS